ncbi:unnamed protein product, partial [Musa acuminata var. zebrina]
DISKALFFIPFKECLHSFFLGFLPLLLLWQLLLFIDLNFLEFNWIRCNPSKSSYTINLYKMQFLDSPHKLILQ